MSLTAGALVVYKHKPARVLSGGDKPEIEILGAGRQRVRPKDVQPLHPGPLESLAALTPPPGNPEEAWELLEGTETTLEELAELVYGTFTPASAWAVWQLLEAGDLFYGAPARIVPRTPAERAEHAERFAAQQAEADRQEAFLARLRRGELNPEDRPRLADVEALALGRATKSRTLAALGRSETPEAAHALLLRVGAWNETMNPYPTRLGVDTRPVTLPLPTLPDEPRLDLTHLPALAIDDEGSLDPDDALSLEALPHGWRLWVHVSDAAALITPDSELDLEARRRGATLYLPEGAVPMLPQAAIEALGLGLGEVSPALSIRVDLDANFEPLEVDVALTRVRVTRLTYAQAQEQLGDEPLATLRRIAAHLREGRAGRGALMIELPEVKVRVHGGQVDVKVLPPLESRQVVQESMMLAGWAVATFGLEHGIPLPYAAQEAFERYDDQATTLPEMYARRRSLKRTQWAAQPAPHAGLGLERYVQSTSPMRRYLDLVAHQQLRAFLAERPFVRTPDMLQRIGAADLASSGVREAERKSLRHWTLVYLSRHRGPWHGVVVDRRGPAATVLLTELALELSLTGDLAPGSELRLEAAEIDLPGLDARVRNVG